MTLRARNSEQDYHEAHRRGLTAEQTASKLEVDAATVRRWWKKLGLQHGNPRRAERPSQPVNYKAIHLKRKELLETAPKLPPSPAMLALAQFDPIVARCVRSRLGQKEEGQDD